MAPSMQSLSRMSVSPRPINLTWPQIEHDWQLFSGHVRATWEKLTGEDVAAIDGRRDSLTGKISERYSLSPEEADAQVDDWVANLHRRVSSAELKTTPMKALRR